MKKLYRVLGKRGRITIPYEIRECVGFSCNDILSFVQQDDNTIVIRREFICDGCEEGQEDVEGEVTLAEFLNGLSDKQQREALIHLSSTIGKPQFSKRDAFEKGGRRNV